MGQKLFVSGLTRNDDCHAAMQELADVINKGLSGHSCDLAFIFVSEQYLDADPAQITGYLRKAINAKCLIGCNSNGVIGDQKEIEMEPAISVMAIHLPDVKVTPFMFTPSDLEHTKDPSQIIHYLDLYPTDEPKFICLADPMTCHITKLLSLFNSAYTDCPLVGGLASGVVVGVDNWLVLNEEVFSEGAIGVALSGDIEFETVVSQGCRPIGEPFIITKSEANIIYELAGESAIKMLNDAVLRLDAKDKKLAEDSLFVGLAMDENRLNHKLGDFLIRNIIGVDQKEGAIAIGETVEVGQTLQFQLRDAQTSREDLKLLLQKPPLSNGHKKGALLINCCGRGKAFYGNPNHDVRLIQTIRGPVPLTGFFANGELGPIRHRNYIHGYTTSLTIIH